MSTQPVNRLANDQPITIHDLPEDCTMRVIFWSAGAPKCAQVSKSWYAAAGRSYEPTFADYQWDKRISLFTPAIMPTGDNPYLEAVKQTYRTIMDRTHAPHTESTRAGLDPSAPLALGPVLKIVEDANLAQLFGEMSDQIPIDERPTLEIEPLHGSPVLDDIARRATIIRSWMENHQASLDRITRFAASHLGFSLNLTTLSPEIGKCTNLQALFLRGSKVVALPQEISQLTSLTYLDLGSNDLITLPPQIGQLTNLHSIYLSDNQRLAALPKEICQLKKLKSLALPNIFLRNIVQVQPLQLGTMTIQVEDLTNLCAFDKIIGAFEKGKTEEALEMFKELPTDTKNAIYGELHKVILPGLKNDYYGCGEDAFLERNGQQTSNADRILAIMRFASNLVKR